MKTSSYSSIRDGILRRMGLDASQPLLASQAAALVEYTHAAIDESWDFFDWPEIFLTEKRTPAGVPGGAGLEYLSDYVGTIYYLGWAATSSPVTSPVWTIKKISTTAGGSVESIGTASLVAWADRATLAYTSSGAVTSDIPYILFDSSVTATPIGTVLAIYSEEPTSTAAPYKLKFAIAEDRVHIIDSAYSGGPVWIKFSLPKPELTVEAYSASTAYSAEDVVYYAPTGDCYKARQATTGNLPTSETHWRRQRIPHFLSEFLKVRAYAETLYEDGQSDKATLQLQRAENNLIQKMDQAWLVAGRQVTWSFTNSPS